MHDELAIQQLINRYSLGVSTPDWDMAIGTFAEQGEWRVVSSGLTLTGREAIRKGMIGLRGLFEWFVQINAPAVIELGGDRARARSVMQEMGKFAGRDETMIAGGIYADELVRTNEGWRFALRSFHAAGAYHHGVKPGVGF